MRLLKYLKMLLMFLTLMMMSTLSEQHYVEYEYRELPRPQSLPHPVPESQELSPSQIMVDLTNELAYRVLHSHSIMNRNNFAYSPTALMSVLVALYEGSAGRSSLELRNALLLPSNRDILRIGYRDIHRRLRTYFFDQENPLVGLSLNKENVTITSEYESLLHFYGYDLGMDMVSSTVAPPTTATTTPINEMTDSSMTKPQKNDAKPTTMTTEKISTTQLPSTTVVTEVPSTTEILTTEKPTTENPTEITTTEITTTEATTETTTEITTDTTQETTTMNETEAPETTTEPTTMASVNVPKDETEDAQFEAENTKEEASSDMLLRLLQPNTFSPNAKIISQPAGPEYLPPSTKKTNSRSSRPLVSGRIQQRDKRHLFGLKGLDTSIYLGLLNTHTQHNHVPLPSYGPQQSVGGIESFHAHPTQAEFSDDDFDAAILAQQVDFTPNFDFFHQHSAPAAIHFDVDHSFTAPKGANHQIINHVFYLNSREIIQSTYKVYNSVLYYKYIEELKMTVLELELDSIEYNLMIMLPDFNNDLLSATASLRFGPTLRALRRQLKPRWVQAIIPDFKLHGKMFLTSDLQNMGVNDVFEPTRADFRPMTEETNIYVKHIEQQIDVNIRTRPINQIKRNVGPLPRPIQVSVNHPFLFFVIDRDLDIATMAGRVLNPLNVRIQ